MLIWHSDCHDLLLMAITSKRLPAPDLGYTQLLLLIQVGTISLLHVTVSDLIVFIVTVQLMEMMNRIPTPCMSVCVSHTDRCKCL